MKKSFSFIVGCAVVCLAALPSFSQGAREATIEPETKARIVLQTPLSSKISEPGDTVTAVLYEPIYVNNQLVLPRGTEFRGRVTAVTPAKRPMKKGSIAIIFEQVAMPWGEEPVAVSFTSIDDWDNDQKRQADGEGKVKGDKTDGNARENVLLGSTVGGAGAGVILLSGGNPAAGAATLGGGVLAGLLFTKGGDVAVKPGVMFRIKFDKALTLPVTQTPGATPLPVKPATSEKSGEATKN